MDAIAQDPNHRAAPMDTLADQVRSAVIWRSGSQILAQIVQWGATFLVIRILNPSDYGLFAMTQVILVLLNMLNGYGLTSGLIQQPHVTRHQIRQLFGMLLLLNGGLALAQVAIAPLAAAYFHQPMVAQLLRVQAFLYLTTPFVALAYALLSREMEFRGQAWVNIVASVASASAALIGALAGLGVWTLVLAPGVLFLVRAIGLTHAARSLVWPSFDFRGAGHLARYGGVMAAGQLFWFLQSQADIFIAGRSLSTYTLGLYSTALFLAQIFVTKIVPPLNEVAFSAYARIQHDAEASAAAFAKALRIIMIAALPFYAGLFATAEPLVLTVLGAKWAGAAPIVRMLACAMPFMTIQVLLAPACDAKGRPGIGVGNGAAGAVVLTVAFLVGIRWGATGLALGWIAGYPIYLAISLWRSLPVIGIRFTVMAAAVAPPAAAAIAMAASVLAIDRVLPAMATPLRLACLVGVGVGVYAALILIVARETVRELIAIVVRRPATA